MSKPLGCMTFAGLAAAFVVALAVLAVAAATGNGIFSPGQLSGVTHSGPLEGATSHADLGARCDACHPAVLSSERMGDRCLVCHAQVRQDIQSESGLHARLLATTANCRDCHTDHRGLAASLTLAEPRVFPPRADGVLAGRPHGDGPGRQRGLPRVPPRRAGVVRRVHLRNLPPVA